MRRSGSLLALALPGALWLQGCEPSCRSVCKKLLSCEEIDAPLVERDECQSQCEVQETLYDEWDDPDLREAFGDLKRCIKDEECDAIADGACYDEDVYIW